MEKKLIETQKILWCVIALLLAVMFYKYYQENENEYKDIHYWSDASVADEELFVALLSLHHWDDDTYGIYKVTSKILSDSSERQRIEAYRTSNLQYYAYSEDKIYDASLPDSLWQDALKSIYTIREKNRFVSIKYSIYWQGKIEVKIYEQTHNKTLLWQSSYQARRVTLRESREKDWEMLQEQTDIPLKDWQKKSRER